MSSIGLDPTESADFADHVARTPGTPLDDPWFTGLTIASPAIGVATGVTNLGFLAEEAAAPVLRPFAEKLDKQFGTSGAAWLDDKQRMAREFIVQQQKISPRVFGKAGDMVRGLVQYGVEATAGTVVGGIAGAAAGAPGGPWISAAGAIVGAPAGAVAVTGLAEALPHYYKLLDEGVDPETAKVLSGVEGIVAGATALLPLHGKTSLGSFGRGAALVPWMNAWQRGATHEILDNAGYHDMAAQYKFFDAQAIATDAVMGALFGGLGHAMHGAPAGERNPTLADAPLVDSVARDREARGPGIPADAYTRDANQAAVEKSIDDLLQGNQVDVSKQIDAERASFVPDPHEEEFRVQVKDVAREVVGPLPADEVRAPTAPAATDVARVNAALAASPITPGKDFDTMAAQRTAQHDEAAAIVKSSPDGWTARDSFSTARMLLGRDPSEPGKWRITTVDEQGAPLSHVEYDSSAKAADEFVIKAKPGTVENRAAAAERAAAPTVPETPSPEPVKAKPARVVEHPSTMTPGKINKEMARLEAQRSAISDEFIAAGRGSEKPTERRGKTDELTLRERAVEDRYQALRQEIRNRTGSDYGTMPRGFKGKPKEPAAPGAESLEREVEATLTDNPTMEVPTKTGELVPAQDAIAAADQKITDAAKAPDMLDAAINCDGKAV